MAFDLARVSQHSQVHAVTCALGLPDHHTRGTADVSAPYTVTTTGSVSLRLEATPETLS